MNFPAHLHPHRLGNASCACKSGGVLAANISQECASYIQIVLRATPVTKTLRTKNHTARLTLPRLGETSPSFNTQSAHRQAAATQPLRRLTQGQDPARDREWKPFVSLLKHGGHWRLQNMPEHLPGQRNSANRSHVWTVRPASQHTK